MKGTGFSCFSHKKGDGFDKKGSVLDDGNAGHYTENIDLCPADSGTGADYHICKKEEKE